MDYFLFDSWFLPKKSVQESVSIGVDLVGIVKTNTKVFCKDTIEVLVKDYPVGSYIVLRSNIMVTWKRLLIAIDYKYYSRKLLPVKTLSL